MLRAAASFALLAAAAAQVTLEVELNAGNGWVVNSGNAPYPDIAANVRLMRHVMALNIVSHLLTYTY